MGSAGNDHARTPRVAAVIVNYRTPAMALAAVAALRVERSAVPGLCAILVDGGSGDGSAEQLREGLAASGDDAWTDLLPLSLNGGFGWANNQAMLALLGAPEPPDHIFLLNPDALIEPGALARLVARIEADPGAGAVGAQLLDETGAPTGSAFRFPSVAREFARGAQTGALERLLRIDPIVVEEARGPVDWVTGAAVLLRAAALQEVGLFDTGFFLYFEETELMWRMRQAGWRILHEPRSRVRHLEGASTGIAAGTAADRPPPPPYWFASRRRFLALTGGRSAGVLANLAWLAGHAVLVTRRTIGIAGSHPRARGEARALLRAGLWPRAVDRTPAAEPPDAQPGREPAWMRGRDGEPTG